MTDPYENQERRPRPTEAMPSPYGRGFGRGYDLARERLERAGSYGERRRRYEWVGGHDEPGPHFEWEGGYGAPGRDWAWESGYEPGPGGRRRGRPPWWVPGPYSGVGPRGYQRSDERILEEVSERLTMHGWIDARDIEVSVDEGEVTLRGTVDGRRTKRLAEDVAETVFGVWDIHNRLRFERGPETRPPSP